MNYIGSKHSLLEFLSNIILRDNPVPGEFVDLFAGTSAVGAYFKKLGWTVTANDMQYYSYILAEHMICNTEPATKDLFDYLNSLAPAYGFIHDNYCPNNNSSRMYFTPENGAKCDAVRIELENLLKMHVISWHDYTHALASLLSCMDRLANTASVYGAYLKKFKHSALKNLIITPLEVIPGSAGRAYNMPDIELLKTVSGDVLYLDPPYNSRQYSSNYHVLETIALGDSPEITGVTGIRTDLKKSDWCMKNKVLNAFEQVIKTAKFKYIYLSYNSEGLMPFEDIKNIMSNYGSYDLAEKEYKRFKADRDENRNTGADTVIEYLHCLRK